MRRTPQTYLYFPLALLALALATPLAAQQGEPALPPAQAEQRLADLAQRYGGGDHTPSDRCLLYTSPSPRDS